MKHLNWILLLLLVAASVPADAAVSGTATPIGICSNVVQAKVVALDQPYFWNRLGAFQPHGMIFALKRDVVSSSSSSLPGPGNAMLRADKRPRPLVLRMNVGDCLSVELTNWLNPTPVDEEQVATRDVSLRVIGLELVGTIASDGSHVGNNNSSLVAPGGVRTYTWHAEREGTYLLYNGGALVGGEGDNGTLSAGLFGAVNVEPQGSVWYRSQVTEEELGWATKKTAYGNAMTTAGGHPVVDYNAKYPSWHKFSGKPILNMLDGNEIFHSDLTAIIAGPNGPIPQTYRRVGVLPERNQPFREFTIIFHDEIAAVQAFPQFNDAELHHTLHSVRDAFAINYGTGGIGAEILANRLGVGPMYECTECLYEEFFLTSWAVGDPAMVVDKPANFPCTVKQLKTEWWSGPSGTDPAPCTPDPGRKAHVAHYPDDPSNVYHSYLNDHVKFRNLLAGSDDHHIFHLHAHQWLRSPDGDRSTYLDSQAIGQGTGFTYEITHNGSGNRNKTAGDSIFHCHFYPHFAMGMWAMWRVHDVFEEGTELNEKGQPVHDVDPAGNVIVQARALPDAEIWEGTPIPGLVPLPGLPMPPMPQAAVKLVNGQVNVDLSTGGNPGYPFWIPGVTGHRPPHPPMDFYQEPGTGVVHDGGLPRHVIVGGEFVEHHTRLNFDKHVTKADAIQLAEQGEVVEKIAMEFHAQIDHPTCLPDGTCDGALSGSTANVRFITNGAQPVPGAPYADPCLAYPPTTTTPPPLFFRTYKGANIQMDVVFSKEGWHFPQQRFLSLWHDVDAFLNQGKPPEPFFFRGNSLDCIDYLHTNLVPKVYELDDFQVRTPTDILGQHIHLVKFDVTSSDGSANGWNYEDGTLSPEEVVSRIHAIRVFNNCLGDEINGGDPRDGTFECPVAQPHPFFGQFGNKDWLGAQTTVQRWYVDDVLSNYGNDRTLRTVFTHDHYGPSTHQQTGLYAGLVVEPKGSNWYHNETGAPLGGQGFQVRDDGGPTSWQAVIEGQAADDVYREFLFEFGDFQHAYVKGSRVVPNADDNVAFAQPFLAINPPGRVEQWADVTGTKPWVYEKPALVGRCPVPDSFSHVLLPPPCPEAISADDPGTKTVNYRQEPLARRIYDPVSKGQALNIPGDMSHVYRSDVTRAISALNVQPTTYQPLTKDVQPKDPYTPLLRAYEGDRVQVRVLVGAHEEEHNFSIHGVRWLFEIEENNSGFRNSQMMGISEHYEFQIPHLPRTGIVERGSVDFLWKAGASVDDLWDGIWGLMRVYKSQNATLHPLSTNDPGLAGEYALVNPCPQGAPVRHYDVSAIAAWKSLPGGTLTYNSRGQALQQCVANSSTGSTSVHPGYTCTSSGLMGPLHDPTAMIFALDSDLVQDLTGTWRLSPNRSPEPLILRAAAGECIEVKLTNRLPDAPFDLPGYSLMPNIVDKFNINQVNPSMEVGLHAQLVSYDVTRDDGLNVGFNPLQTVKPSLSRTYRWYAGQWVPNSTGGLSPVPTEFGSINLNSSDPIKHSNKGLVGALVIEPQNAYWQTDPGTRAQAKVYPSILDAEANPDNYFREFVTIFQTDPNLRYSDEKQTPVRPLIVSEDPAETGQNSINYRTEPVWFRLGILPETKTNVTRQIDMAHVFSNNQIGGLDPETPVYTVDAGRATRFRVTHGGGHSQQNVFGVHGHVWEEQPYVSASKVLDPDNNPYSEYRGSQYGHGPSNHFDVLLKHGAGGAFGVTGDFMWRDYVSWYLSSGLWGIMRVTP